MSDSLNESARQSTNRNSHSRRDKPQTLSGIEATKALNLQATASGAAGTSKTETQSDMQRAELAANLARNRARSRTIGSRDIGGESGGGATATRDERKHSCDGVVSISSCSDIGSGGVNSNTPGGAAAGGHCGSGSGIDEFSGSDNTRRRESLNYEDTSPCSHNFNKAIFGRTAHSRTGGVGGGGMTRKCVLTLDGYSYVIVASTPDSVPKRERDDLPTGGSGTICGSTTPIGSTSGSAASERRSKADSPTGSNSAGFITSGTAAFTSDDLSSTTTTTTSSTVESVTINGQIGRHGSLTIVRRSNSRKSFIQLDAQQQSILTSPSTAATTPVGGTSHQQLHTQQPFAGITADLAAQLLSSSSCSSDKKGQQSPSNFPTDTNSTNSNSSDSRFEVDSKVPASITPNNSTAVRVGASNTSTAACTNSYNATAAAAAAAVNNNNSDNNTSKKYSSTTNRNIAANTVTSKMQSSPPISPDAANFRDNIRDNGEEERASEVTVATGVSDSSAASLDLATENLPAVDTPDACDKAAVRLRCLLHLINTGEISNDILQRNLHYAARVLEAVFLDESKRSSASNECSKSGSSSKITAQTSNADQQTRGANDSQQRCNGNCRNVNCSHEQHQLSCGSGGAGAGDGVGDDGGGSSQSNQDNNNLCNSCSLHTDNQQQQQSNASDNQTSIDSRTKGVTLAPQTHSGPTGPPDTIFEADAETEVAAEMEAAKATSDAKTNTQAEQEHSNIAKVETTTAPPGAAKVASADGKSETQCTGGVGGGGRDDDQSVGSSSSNKATMQRQRRLRTPVWARSMSSKNKTYIRSYNV